MNIIISLITGALAGFIAGKIMKGKGSGCLINLIVGIIGAVIGGWVFDLLGITAVTWLGTLITSVVGAVLFLWILSFFTGRRR